jgi:hypothetical protein
MPQVPLLTGGGTLTMPVWVQGTAWTKLGGGSELVGGDGRFNTLC